MSELHCQTNVAIAKRSSRASTVKKNQVSPLNQHELAHQHQITPSNFIIQPSKSLKKRKPLPFSTQLSTRYSCGFSLKSLTVQNNSYQIMRIKRFPHSQFEIIESSEKNRVFTLTSNFLGTKYNLCEHQQIILTVVFAAGLCSNFGSRQLSIYSLSQNVSYANLEKESDNQDLQQLYGLPQNLHKISKLITLQPKRNIDNGQLQLNFARKNIVPAVQNAILINILGDQTMEIVKLGENVYEVSSQQIIPKIWSVALGIASLDFKWALQ